MLLEVLINQLKCYQVSITLATGCGDKNVRVYYAATSTDQPMKVFSGEYYAATSTDQPIKVFTGKY